MLGLSPQPWAWGSQVFEKLSFQQFFTGFILHVLLQRKKKWGRPNRKNRFSYYLLSDFPKVLVEQQLSPGQCGCQLLLQQVESSSSSEPELCPACASWPGGFGSLLFQRVQRTHTQKRSTQSEFCLGFLQVLCSFSTCRIPVWNLEAVDCSCLKNVSKRRKWKASCCGLTWSWKPAYVFNGVSGYPGCEQEQAESHRCALQKRLWGSSWPD